MVILSDLDGTIIRCNRAFKDFIGRTYAEILRENFASLMTNFGIEVKDLDIRNLNARLYIMGKWFIVTSYPIEEFETGKVVKAVILMQDAATTRGSAKVQFIWGRAGYYRPDESQANRLPFPS
jgi:PAS domain-containing protein